MIEMKNDVLYLLVCSLVILVLILPIATAIVERIFSAMNIIKSWLQNRMRDQWMNNCLVIYIEKYIYEIFWNRCMISSHSIVSNIYIYKIWNFVKDSWCKLNYVWKNILKFTFYVRLCMTITLAYSYLFILLLILINNF